MSPSPIKTDILIIGGGLAGIVAALELLDSNYRVTLVERGDAANFGGLAKESFGGIFLVNTREQKWSGIHDSTDLALKDWMAAAEFGAEDEIPRQWAKYYVDSCKERVGDYLHHHGVHFFPVVHWVEKQGNTVPRFHMVWGTGYGLTNSLIRHLKHHPHASRLQIMFQSKIEDLTFDNGRVVGARGVHTVTEEVFEVRADATVIASGGICGDLGKVRKHWYAPWGKPPPVILNGAHPFSDGILHDAAANIGARLTHMDHMWCYAAGVHHPRPQFENHGLSLVPPKSALWMDHRAHRIGPHPLVAGFDTRYLVEQISRLPAQYSWQIFNYKIAKKELAVSGAEYNESVRDKKLWAFLMATLRGNTQLVDDLTRTCPDFVTAHSLEELAQKMNVVTSTPEVKATILEQEIAAYDAAIDRGPPYADEQLQRIAQSRIYRGDRVRTCNFQKILDPKAMPLIAVREFILSRKSLGGMQTDLSCRVLDNASKPIPGLYAVGEASGFGGGGMCGIKSLEGTFLGGCILTGRRAAEAMMG